MHQTIEMGTGTDIYITDAYQSNQRARNGNANSLLQQFLPKSMRLETLNLDHVSEIALQH